MFIAAALVHIVHIDGRLRLFSHHLWPAAGHWFCASGWSLSIYGRLRDTGSALVVRVCGGALPTQPFRLRADRQYGTWTFAMCLHKGCNMSDAGKLSSLGYVDLVSPLRHEPLSCLCPWGERLIGCRSEVSASPPACATCPGMSSSGF